MHDDDSPLKRLQQLLATAPCTSAFFSRFAEDRSVPMELLTRIADELEAELRPAQEDLVVLTPYQKNGQTEFAQVGTSFWYQQNLHVTLHAVPLSGTLLLRLAAPIATPAKQRSAPRSRRKT